MRNQGCLIGLDIGSGSVRAVALAVETGSLVSSAQRPTPITRSAGKAEIDPEALRRAVEDVLRELLALLPAGSTALGVAATSVGETAGAVDRDGNVLAPVIWWQDARSDGQVARLVEALGVDRLDSLVGHPPDPTWGIGRLMWLRENQPQVYDRTAAWLPIADLVTLWLTGEAVTSPSLASRTMAWDQGKGCWSEAVADAAGVDLARLPQVVSSGTVAGRVTSEAAERTGLPAGLPVSVAGHDRQCGAFAARQATSAPVDSAGTAEGLLVPGIGPDDTRRIGTGISRYQDVVPGQHTYAARVGLAGGLLDWASQALFGSATVDYAAMVADVTAPYEFTGVVCTPTFGRYSSPHWSEGVVPGTIHGLTAAHTRADVVQALLEAPAFALRANLDLLETWLPGTPDTVRVEGGVVRNLPWMQARADITGRPLLSVEQANMTALGAALLSGVGAAVFASATDAGGALRLELREWTPDPARTARYDEAYHEHFLGLAEFSASTSDRPPRRCAERSPTREVAPA